MSELTDREHAELIMLYQVTIEDIERTKRWGWNITYTTIAGQGAIFGLFTAHRAVRMPLAELCGVRFLFSALTVGLMILGLVHISDVQRNLKAFRDRLKEVRKNYGEPFESCFGQPDIEQVLPLVFAVVAATVVFLILLFM